MSHLRVWLDRNFWMRRRGSGFQLVTMQKPVTHEAPRKNMRVPRVARLLAPRPDAKRPSRMSACRKSMTWCPTPRWCNGVQVWELARVLVRAQGQPAGTEEGSESSDESGSLPVPNSARVVPGRRQHRLRIPTYHMMCRDGKLEKLLLEQ